MTDCMPSCAKGEVVWLVTANLHKYREVREILKDHNLAVGMLKSVDAVEIQDDDIKRIAAASALDAVKKSRLSTVVEDAGLFIDTLNGFPGPYSSFVFRTIGNEGILKLMRMVTDRSARFRSVVAFSSPETRKPVCFSGEVEGEILSQKLGVKGFGFDPIFKPRRSSKTFAQMTIQEKNKRSHRAAAFRQFAQWYTTSPQP